MSVPFDRWTYAARILEVHDGDTVRAEIDLGFSVTFRTTLRLLGIQAPEVGGPNVTDAEKVAGRAARDALAGLLLHAVGNVYVQTSKDHTEGRGRYLARILIEQGAKTFDVGALLVQDGLAVRYDGKGKAPKWTPAGWVAA